MPLSDLNQLPASFLNSKILTSNNLNQLCMIEEIPTINPGFDDNRLKNIIQYYSINPDEMETELHRYAKELLDARKTDKAWQVLLTTI